MTYLKAIWNEYISMKGLSMARIIKCITNIPKVNQQPPVVGTHINAMIRTTGMMFFLYFFFLFSLKEFVQCFDDFMRIVRKYLIPPSSADFII